MTETQKEQQMETLQTVVTQSVASAVRAAAIDLSRREDRIVGVSEMLRTIITEWLLARGQK
jgi:hypothetical protein